MSYKNLIILLGGILFGFGLALSGMTRPEIVLSFLQLQDLGLLLVLGGAVLVTMFTYQVFPRFVKKPLIGKNFGKGAENSMKKTLVGALIFGIGWGISGVCPGAALASLGTGNYPIIISILSIFLGAYAQGRFFGDENL